MLSLFLKCAKNCKSQTTKFGDSLCLKTEASILTYKYLYSWTTFVPTCPTPFLTMAQNTLVLVEYSNMCTNHPHPHHHTHHLSPVHFTDTTSSILQIQSLCPVYVTDIVCHFLVPCKHFWYFSVWVWFLSIFLFILLNTNSMYCDKGMERNRVLLSSVLLWSW